MYTVEYQTFEDMVHRALAALPKSHRSSINNVAILIEDEPSLAQRYALNLRGDQTLFGLYEGVPLNAGWGRQKYCRTRSHFSKTAGAGQLQPSGTAEPGGPYHLARSRPLLRLKPYPYLRAGSRGKTFKTTRTIDKPAVQP